MDDFFVYLLILSGSTYLIRTLPFAFFKKPIENKFVKAFLYYIPYSVLAAMTLPAIFYSTGSTVTAVIGTAVAVILAYFKLPLIVVSVAACVAAFAAGMVL